MLGKVETIFWLVDAQGIILDLNEAALRVSGGGREAVVGRFVADLPGWQDPPLLPRSAAGLRAAMTNGLSFRGVAWASCGAAQEADLCCLRLRLHALASPAAGLSLLVEAHESPDPATVQGRLADTERRYQELFETMLSGCARHEVLFSACGHPIDYRFIEVNRTFERLTGLRREDILGRTVLEIMPDTEPFWIETYGAVVQTGEPVQFVHRSAAIGKYFEVVAHRLDDRHFACMFNDITAEIQAINQLKASKEHYHSLLDSSPAGIFHYEASKVITYHNHKFCEILHLEVSEIDERGAAVLDDPAQQAAINAALLGEVGFFEGPLCANAPGPAIQVCLICSPLRNDEGRLMGGIGIVQDISERKAREKEMQALIAHLTDVNTELERFAYVASHDLREPLRTIASFTQLLHHRYKGKLDADADEFITLIVEGARRMHTLIGDLLAYSRVSDKGGPFTLVDTGEACLIALQNLRESIDEARAKVEVSPLPRVSGDPVQIMQVFQNLIGNAVKFRHPDRPCLVQVMAVWGSEGWRFSVIDNGIGIGETTQDIFEIFRRLHGASSYPGTGVGLAIAKRIIQRHGGRIWHEPNALGGASFHFTIAPFAGSSP